MSKVILIISAIFFLIFSLSSCGKCEDIQSTGAIPIPDKSKIIIADTTDAADAYQKVRSWGLRRIPGHVPPDAGPGAAEFIAKYNCLYLADSSISKVYLTFDEGYENGYTSKILDSLKKYDVKALFFITGPYLKRSPELVERMLKEGHEVGNHTDGHPSLPGLANERIVLEITKLENDYFHKFQKGMKYFRPPKGEYNGRVLETAANLGYITLFWSFAYDDWHKDKVRGADYARDIVLHNLHSGAIILLHAVSADNAAAMNAIIEGTINMGYSFGNINEINPIDSD